MPAYLIPALDPGLRAFSGARGLPTEQHHASADPLVLVALGLIVGSLWPSLPRLGSQASHGVRPRAYTPQALRGTERVSPDYDRGAPAAAWAAAWI